MHISWQSNCQSLRCSWSIACGRCSKYIFILDLTPGFIGLGKDNCKTRRETFKFGDLVHVILEILWYIKSLLFIIYALLAFSLIYLVFLHIEQGTQYTGQCKLNLYMLMFLRNNKCFHFLSFPDITVKWGNFGQYKTFILSNSFCHLKNDLVVNMEVKGYLQSVICFKRSFIRLDPMMS